MLMEININIRLKLATFAICRTLYVCVSMVLKLSMNQLPEANDGKTAVLMSTSEKIN